MNVHVQPGSTQGPPGKVERRRARKDAAHAGFSVSVQPHPAGLQVEVLGEGTFENTIAYWQVIVEHLHRHDARGVLLIDRMTGPALSAEQWRALVQAMEGKGLEHVRIAHVKPNGLQDIEYCEIYALEAGIDAMVFEDDRLADLWLRHPER